ncbi:MAG: cupin domain-containing protein [Candidatus Nanopelagicaceae bacterium]
MNPDSLIKSLNLEPLAGEGGLWSLIYRDETSNAIYFMMKEPDFSAWHILEEPELWVHLAGSPITLFTIESSRLIERELSRESENFTYRVPAKTWMAARPKGAWSLALCALTPPFSKMELGHASTMREEFPQLEIPELFHE